MEHKIKLFPASWLYNAGVIGFLRVLAYGMGEEKIESWLKDDGTVEVDRGVFRKELGGQKLPICMKYLVEFLVKDEDLEAWKEKKDNKGKKNKDKYADFAKDMGDFGYKFIRAGNKLFASQTPYQNLVQFKEWQKFEFAKLIAGLENYKFNCSDISCSLCGNRAVKRPHPKSKLENRLFVFQEPHLRILAPSKGEFPNSFWNLNTSFYLCPFCVYLLIHHHIPFIKTQHGDIFIDIFINAPSFKIMWYLNKLAKEFLQRGKEFTLREILGTSLMELTQRIYLTLGVWSLMQIEMVITKTKNTEVAYYSLPFNTARILLNRNVANLVSATQEPYILQCVLNEDFEALLFLSHCILGVLQGRKDQSLEGKIKNQNRSHLSTLAQILPTLYVKINSLIKGA